MDVRRGYEIYEGYLIANQEDIGAGKEVFLEVRDLTEFTRKIIRAKVGAIKAELPGSEDLWVRTPEKEDLKREPLAILVLEELDEDFEIKRPALEGEYHYHKR